MRSLSHLFRARSHLATPILALIVSVGVTACSEGGTGPALVSSVSLSVTARSAGPDGAVFNDGIHELILLRTALVVRGVALSRAGGAACSAGGATSSGCQPLEERPFLLDIPLDGSVRTLVAAAVPAARYDEVRVALHVPSPDSAVDGGLLSLHPEFAGAAVRVEGTWDGEPFEFVSTLGEVWTVALRPPVDVGGRTTNLTVRLDVGEWFVATDGHLIDPRLAVPGGDVAAQIDARIRASFEAFGDPDADGMEGDG